MIKNRINATAKASLMIITIIQLSCITKIPTDLSKESIIPKPVSVTATGDRFLLNAETDIYINGDSNELKLIGQYLAEILKPSTGFEIEVKSTGREPGKGNFYLMTTTASSDLGNEGYELQITKKLVKLAAGSPEGLFRGIQTIRQILPPDIEKHSKTERRWEIATGSITDFPEYSYRGAMLDVARHFFDVDEVKRFVDFLASYKMNALHLHLTDDQGWRIEIKSWPELAKHGGKTQVDGGGGGYYTQEQYTDIVKYANERFIMLIPEIDMPGHTNAALASYPELNSNGKAKELYEGVDVGFSTLCTNKEITYKFIDDVIRELGELTPGSYIHIGGDESHSTKKEDYIPFISKVQDIATAHGKKAIGWDEISFSELKPNTLAQYWAHAENAKRAVSQGAKLIVSPASKAYLDMKYDSTTKFGQYWAGFVEVDTAYIWDPATLVPGIGRENILGVEAPLWTEAVTNMEELEYMIFPRLPGHAEIGWTPSSMRDWEEYRVRLGKHGERLSAMGINYYKSGLVPWTDIPK